VKLGVEVEGRLRGLRTLFLQASECKGKNAEEIKQSIPEGMNVEQIYISDLENEFKLTGLWLHRLAEDFLVTVEVTELTCKPPEGVNVILRIDSPSFWHLRETDQIKFTTEENHVWMYVAEQGMATRPEAFEKDKVL
jgi:hypothetical protein